MSLMAVDVTEATFEQEVLKSETPVIVDFWAEWCGPCHAVAPVLEKIAEERKDEVKLVKVNIDEEQGLSMKYGVMSIPTMIRSRCWRSRWASRPDVEVLLPNGRCNLIGPVCSGFAFVRICSRLPPPPPLTDGPVRRPLGLLRTPLSPSGEERARSSRTPARRPRADRHDGTRRAR